jgi:hypothetical protein
MSRHGRGVRFGPPPELPLLLLLLPLTAAVQPSPAGEPSTPRTPAPQASQVGVWVDAKGCASWGSLAILPAALL